MRVIFAFALVALALAGSVAAAPPAISEDYSAEIELLWIDYTVGGNVTSYLMKLYSAQSLGLHASQVQLSAYGESVSVSNYNTNITTSYLPKLQYCSTEPTGDDDNHGIFAFLPYSKKMDNHDVFGINCDVWGLTQPGLSVSACITADNTPIQMVVTMSTGYNGVSAVGYIYNFKDFTAGVPASSYFDIPAYCQKEANSAFSSASKAHISHSVHRDALQSLRGIRN